MNRRLLELVTEFNQERRQSQAAAERRFVEARREEAKGELEEAERNLQRFLEQNRSYESSPQLVFEAQRLQRSVDINQQLYTSLAQSYEQARIAETVTHPSLPSWTSPRRPALPRAV